jgi:hypothetical protein
MFTSLVSRPLRSLAHTTMEWGCVRIRFPPYKCCRPSSRQEPSQRLHALVLDKNIRLSPAWRRCRVRNCHIFPARLCHFTIVEVRVPGEIENPLHERFRAHRLRGRQNCRPRKSYVRHLLPPPQPPGLLTLLFLGCLIRGRPIVCKILRAHGVA